MTTYLGTAKDDVWLIQWAAVVNIDGLGGVDTLRLGTSKRTDYQIMQAEDGAILVESVSRASSPFKGKLYNIEKLVFDNGKDVMDLTVQFLPNKPPTGSLIVTGVLNQGQGLAVTPSFSDADGLGAVQYIWEGKDAQGVVQAIGSGMSLSLLPEHVGLSIRAVADYVDGAGNPERFPSNWTPTLQPNSVRASANTGELLVGTEWVDRLIGGSGDDRLRGGLRDDLLEGGGGRDTALFGSNAEDYEVSFLGGGVWTVQFSGPVIAVAPPPPTEGTDTLKEMEVLEFADRRVLIEREESPSYADLPADLYQFFIVAFNAAPGVTYMNQLAEAYRYWMLPGGRSSEEVVQQVVDVFITKSQFTDVYGLGLENTAFARLLVKNIVKSSASEEAKEQAVRDIVDALGVSGWGRGKVIYTVFGNLADKPFEDGVWGGTARLFANEIAVAKAYTEVMDQSTTDLATLRSVLEATGAESEVLTQEQAVALAVKGLMGQGGLVSGWQEPTSLWDPWTIDPIFGLGGV